EELVEVADDSQRLGRHHRTSAITLVVPTCSIAPQSPPYVKRLPPRRFAARSSAPITRSIAGKVSGSWLLPTFTSASTPGKSKSSMPSALPSVDMSSTTAVVFTPRASHREAARAAMSARRAAAGVRGPAADLGEDGAVGAERVRDEPGGEERRAYALGLG